MTKFKNEDYTEILTDCIHDIFYTETSYRGKIAHIRVFSEIIVRKLIDFEPDKQLTIGNTEVLRDIRNLDNGAYYEQCILALKDNALYYNANSCSHSKTRRRITQQDYDSIHDSFLNLLSCIFIQYFTKYKFGSNPSIMTFFSCLPPIIRYKVLSYLYTIDNTNVDVIDKLTLAIMKAFNPDKAKEWVDKEKEHLLTIPAFSLEFAPMADFLGLTQNMYECCCEKIAFELTGKYHTIEEAKSTYDQNKERYETTDDSIREFRDLMDFVFIGRKNEE